MAVELVKLTTAEFERLAKLVYERTGIHLPDSKLTLLSNRLRRRLRVLNLDGFGGYYDLLRDPKRSEEELPHFLSAVTTNETYFFRNEALWKYFRGTWLLELIKRKTAKKSQTIRIWSAASSSGEEAYTAAICLCDDLPDRAKWNVTVIGSDISQRVLDKAGAGEYNDYAVSRVTPATMKKWFTKTGEVYRLKDEVRNVVKFQFHNLRDAFPQGNFDLVFLRNVLMYFDNDMKKTVLNNVTKALAPGGHLVVGDVDPIRQTPELHQSLALDYAGPNLYKKPETVKTPVPVGTSG